jgi:hypothetical protein
VVALVSAHVILTEHQLRLLQRSAEALPVRERDAFKHTVLSRLRGQVSTGALVEVINQLMTARPMFLLADAGPVETRISKRQASFNASKPGGSIKLFNSGASKSSVSTGQAISDHPANPVREKSHEETPAA